MNQSQFRSFLSLSLLIVFFLSACLPVPTFSKPGETPTPAKARFEPAACMFGTPTGVDCGYLHVSEDRSKPGGTQIRLAVAIIHSSNSTPAPDPVLILMGWIEGPGAHRLAYTDGFKIIFKEILATRDIIIFDQRGSGFSAPALECPEVKTQALTDAPQNLDEEESQRHRFDAYESCHDRLAQAGTDLSAYSMAADAADINDLRVALGHKEWNIYGDAYGARLALRVMRDFPAGVRSVVLDSVYPPQANLDADAVANADRALKLLFERCAADKLCNADYPDLERVFYETADLLDANPIGMDVKSEVSREKVMMLVNGDRFINLIVHLLYFDPALGYIPAWIYKFNEGTANSDAMLKAYMYFFVFAPEVVSEGKAMSVLCGEALSPASETATDEIPPRLQKVLSQGRYLALCPAWGIEPTPALEIPALVSDIPTLLLTGDNSPGSSLAWSRSTAEKLVNSFAFEFKGASSGLGYGALGTSICARKMTSAFIADPTIKPDATCVDRLLGIDFISR